PGSDRIDDLAHTLGSLFTDGQLGPDTCVAGNGFGGFVALGVAVHYGSLFERLLLLGCGAGFSPEGKRAFAAMAALVEKGGMAAVVETALRRIFTEDYIAGHPEEADQRRRVLADIPVVSFVNGCRALMEVDYQPQLTQVSNPTLVVTGAEDRATPPTLGEELAGMMPRATFRLLPGLAHAPHLQDPSTLLASVGDFLDLEN
ncbi:MAG TPA: alpha/beta fold hydrolase, partial [Acidimicrobiia bacterium]|nr:alpha/beta fold hydrolase [Acidimicrobiia bacterium]